MLNAKITGVATAHEENSRRALPPANDVAAAIASIQIDQGARAHGQRRPTALRSSAAAAIP